MPDGTQRKLTAIVFADVVGYSRLMGADEAGTLQRLKAHRAELIDGLIGLHGGRIVKTIGDGLLLDFSSLIAAMECVIAVQTGMLARNEGLEPDQAMRFRIGVHLGDVIVDGDDIHGDGVNVAARLQEISEAGGIAISDAVHGQIKGRIDAVFEDTGERELKNIAAPVRVWRFVASDTPADVTVPVDQDSGKRPAVAVLPFTNLSNDPEQEYFADGITEDVITALSYQKLFPVIARNTTFVFKGQSVDIGEVGRKLNAGYVVEGSVRKAGQRVRITAQLIEVASGHHVWAQRYDRVLDDIFDLQDEITDALVRAIAPELISYERQRVRSNNPRDMTAWDLYLRGLSAIHIGTTEALMEAERFARQAIARDAMFALGHSLLSLTINVQNHRNLGKRTRAHYEEMLQEARRAVELDDRDSNAWAVWGLALGHNGDFEQGMEASRRAVGLNPYAFLPRLAMGNSHLFGGRIAEAITEFQEALRIGGSDEDILHAHTMMLWSQYLSSNYDAAIVAGRKAELLVPDYLQVHIAMDAAFGQTGDIDHAQLYTEKIFAAVPKFNTARYRRNIRWHDPAMIDHVVEGLVKAGLPET